MVVNKGYEIEVTVLKMLDVSNCGYIYEACLSYILSFGRQVFHACLDEYAALDVWVLDEERNIAFVD